MCQLGVEQGHPSAPTRWQEQPNIPDNEPGINQDTEVRSDSPFLALISQVLQNPCSSNTISMASSNNISQPSGSHYSQAIHLHAAQDAPAEIALPARPTSDGITSVGGATTSSKLGSVDHRDSGNDARALSEENLQHRLNASGSVQAIVVDDDVLFAGLQGGDIVVSRVLTRDFVNLTSSIGLVT